MGGFALGFFKNRAINYEHKIWLDRARSWIPFGFQVQLATLPCDECSLPGFTKAGHGGLKVWVDPTADGARQQSSLTQDNALYFYQHLNDYYYSRRAGEGVESTFLTSTPHEAKAAEAIAALLEGLTAAPTAGEGTSFAARLDLEREHLHSLSEHIMLHRPGLAHVIKSHQCESKESHEALLIYPPEFEKLNFGEGRLLQIPDVNTLALHIYECQNEWYVTNASGSIHSKMSWFRQGGLLALTLALFEPIDTMKESWRRLSELTTDKTHPPTD